MNVAWILSQARLVCLSILVASSVLAADYAVLKTGFRIRTESHERIGDKIRLHTGAGGRVDLAADAVVGFDPIEDAPPVDIVEELEPSREPKTLDQVVNELAEAMSLHPALVHSVIAAESNYDPGAVSPKGAVGLMQLMPETAAELQVDPYQPQQNVAGGVRYLREMLERYDGSLLKALAAYNAGPGAVDRYGDLPPYDETRAYVTRVIRRFLALTSPGS